MGLNQIAYAKMINRQSSYWLNQAMESLHEAAMMPNGFERRAIKRRAKACLGYAKADRLTARREGWKLP